MKAKPMSSKKNKLISTELGADQIVSAIGQAFTIEPQPPPSWEYDTFSPMDRATPAELDAYGSNGWELVAVVHFTCYFKRSRS